MENKYTPQGKGFRTAYQAVAGTVTAFLTGLWALPGVKEYTVGFIQTQGVALLVVLLGLVGISSGLIAFLQNRAGK